MSDVRLFRRRKGGRPVGPWIAWGYDHRGQRWSESTRQIDEKAARDVARDLERRHASPAAARAEAATLDAAADALVRHALDTLAQEIRTLRNRGEARRSDAARLIYEAERVEAHADALAAALATMQGAGGGA